MSGCRRQTTKKYTERNSPPFPANQCPGALKLGNDNELYKSSPDINGVCRWSKVKGCDGCPNHCTSYCCCSKCFQKNQMAKVKSPKPKSTKKGSTKGKSKGKSNKKGGRKGKSSIKKRQSRSRSRSIKK